MTPLEAEPAAPPPRKQHPAVEWWERLHHPRHGNPGAIAQLRRCRSTVEAMRLREAIALAVRLGTVRPGAEAPDRRVRAAVDLSRVLAHVKKNDRGRHPMQAAGWRQFAGDRSELELPPRDRPRLSGTRFRRLLQTGDGEEKVTAFVRLVALLDGEVDVETLARDFIAWSDPVRGDAVRERWAFHYYGAANAAPTPSSSDPDPENDE